ncbi:hypothetical protein F0U61_06460 [Archangium violaceum]|uniref:hypothetical protein n=1 Tax=Archangium violaceum TaxID=83451 RepID=UPI002B3172CD|nr:hypothetical protein F0U61_06460 [Archangium violaceum]
MGEEFLRVKTEQFKHGQDRSHREFKQETLLTLRPELVGEAFSCFMDSPDKKMPPAGSKLLLSDTGAELILDADGGRIGTVNESESQGLRGLMAAVPECCGMLEVTVHETMEGFGAFTIRVVTTPTEDSKG